MKLLKIHILATLFAIATAATASPIIPHPSSLIPILDSTHIQVKVKGIPAGVVKLVGVYGDQNYLADSAVVDVEGKFEIRREHPLPAGFYTFLLPSTKNFALLMDEDQHFKLDLDIADVLGSMKIEGSECIETFYRNAKFQLAQDAELRQLAEKQKTLAPASPEAAAVKKRQDEILADRKKHLQEIYDSQPNSFFTKFKIAGQNPDPTFPKKPNGDTDTLRQLIQYRADFWKGVDFNDPRLLHTPVISNKLRRYIKELVPQQRDSIWKVAEPLIRQVQPYKPYFKLFANWIAMQHENTKTTVMDGEYVYVQVIKTFFTPELAFWSNPKEIEGLQKHVWEMENSLLWKKAANITAKDMTGATQSMFDSKAPLIVLFMFHPDCEHCQKEAPEITRISQKWKGRGVDFFGVVLETDASKAQKWHDFVKKHNFQFPVVNDPSNRAIYPNYWVDITPEIYVLDKDRVIVSKNLKSSQLEEVFDQQFKKMNK